jgi:erythrocyte band 7 integral membrane protein
MQRAMATEAESTREARAKVVAAEGEQKASVALKAAADIISESPTALQLRYLQTLSDISAEQNSTIIFPVSSYFYNNLELHLLSLINPFKIPIELLQSFPRKS